MGGGGGGGGVKGNEANRDSLVDTEEGCMDIEIDSWADKEGKVKGTDETRVCTLSLVYFSCMACLAPL